jgi:hypothetical protein
MKQLDYLYSAIISMVRMMNDSELRVKLVEEHGKTSIFIDAYIDNDGGLVISGQDLGEFPEKYWGDSDYEYWLTISAKDKDRVLLALLESQYKGDFKVISNFKAKLDKKKIPYDFGTWV